MILVYMLQVLAKDICLPGSSECSNNMLRICDINGFWIQTDCPKDTECSVKDGIVGCVPDTEENDKSHGSVVDKLLKSSNNKKPKDKLKKENDENSEEDDEDSRPHSRKDEGDSKKEILSRLTSLIMRKLKKEDDEDDEEEEEPKKKPKRRKKHPKHTEENEEDENDERNKKVVVKRTKPKGKNIRTVTYEKRRGNRKSDSHDEHGSQDKPHTVTVTKTIVKEDKVEKIDVDLSVEKEKNVKNSVNHKSFNNSQKPPIKNINYNLVQPLAGPNSQQPSSKNQNTNSSQQPNKPQDGNGQSSGGSPPNGNNSKPSGGSGGSAQSGGGNSKPSGGSGGSSQSGGGSSKPSGGNGGSAQTGGGSSKPSGGSGGSAQTGGGSSKPSGGSGGSSQAGGGNSKPSGGAASPPAEGTTKPTGGSSSSSSGSSENKSSSSSSKSSSSSSGGGGGGAVNITADQVTEAMSKNNYQPKPEYVEAIVKVTNEEFKSKEEAAMFLAQTGHESGGFQYIEEIDCAGSTKCADQYGGSEGAPGKSYHGRGFIQLSWPANYKEASEALGMGDELFQNPEKVAEDPELGAKVSVWFWQTKVATAPGVSDNQFGATTKAINGALECTGSNVDKSKNRYKVYKDLAEVLQISPLADEGGCY